MTSTLRAAAGAAAVAVIAALAVVLPTGAAQAATTYTWVAGWDGNGDGIPGADHVSWENAKNWSPASVPGAGDTVVLTNAPASNGHVQSSTELNAPVGGVTVASLRIEQPGAGSVRLRQGPVTVTDAFDWTGGEVHAPVTLAGGANGRIGAGQLKPLHAEMTVQGRLTLDGLGNDPDTELQLYPDYTGDDDGITVTAGGTLAAHGANLVAGTGCCTDPAKVVVNGTADVAGGTTTFSAVELSLKGTTRVAKGSVLRSTVGSSRLGAQARYVGGGTVDFTETASIRSNPDREPVPGGILMEGTGQLADQTRIHFGIGAKLTGVGGFTGAGTIDVSATANPGQNGAHIYGDLSIGAATRLQVGGAVPSRLESWSPGLAGYHGVLRINGNAELARGSSFTTQGGTVTSVAKGATLRLAPGSTWGEGDCCTQPARLISAGTLAVPAGAGAAARIVRVDLRNQGTLALAAGKRLATEGYPARLGGTLQVTGTTKPGRQRTVVTGQQLIGRFACVRPTGQAATYTATSVRVTGILGKTGRCVSATGTKLAAKKLGKHKTLKVRATKGVGKKAKRVLVAVTVSKVRKPAKIKVAGAPAFKAAKGTTTRYVVAKRKNKKFVTVRNAGKKPVKVKVVLFGVA